MTIKIFYKTVLWVLVPSLIFFPALAFCYWFDYFGLTGDPLMYFICGLAGVAGLIAERAEPKVHKLFKLD
jgi:hypothetical protein